MWSSVSRLVATLAVLFLAAAGAMAQDGIRTEVVKFARGASSATLRGSITGYSTVEYKVGASAGQRMEVTLSPSNTASYFNLIAPSGLPAIHIGSIAGNSFSGRLPESGTYTIQVYLMRSAARRDERSDYTLAIAIDNKAAPAASTTGQVVVQPNSSEPDAWRVTGLPPGDALNIHTEPSVRSPVIARVPEGEVMGNLGCRTVSGQRWCQVDVTSGPAMRGWAVARYLSDASNRPPRKPTRRDHGGEIGTGLAIVSGLSGGDRLNLRSGPSTRASIVGRLPEGYVLRNLGCRVSGGTLWCHVEDPARRGISGWVAGRYLRRNVETLPKPVPMTAPSLPGDVDAIVPGTPYHAVGPIPCSFDGDASVTSCHFGVIRSGPGSARVDITFPDGFIRKLVFSGGRVHSPDGGEVTAHRSGDTTFVTVNGSEHFTIPDAVVDGG